MLVFQFYLLNLNRLLDNTREPEHPCLVLIDEARELDVAEVRRIAGIGRGRGIGMALSYQDYPQVLDQYGDKGAKAILETCMTKLFLPGCNGETATYASDLLGKTTVHTETSVDYKGTDRDNTRYSEAGRALMLPDEIRQMPKFRQLLVVTDTAPPVKAAFPPVYLRRDIQKPVVYRKPEVLRFSNAQIFRGNNFAQPIGANSATAASVKPKKMPKGKRTKNQSAVSSSNDVDFESSEQSVTGSVENGVALQNESRFVSPDNLKLDSAASETTDRALSEIGERMADFETSGAGDDGNSILALADDEHRDEKTEDFMEQELKTFLLDEKTKTPVLIENDSDGAEVVDCFDSETVLRTEIMKSSEGGIETNRETTLSGNYSLTEEETERERTHTRQSLEPENDFYNALVQRVL